MDYFSEDFMGPPESYARKINRHVCLEEMPYGYTESPPPADTGNYDQRALETKNQYSPRKLHGR